jgi:hypothetical protein
VPAEFGPWADIAALQKKRRLALDAGTGFILHKKDKMLILDQNLN